MCTQGAFNSMKNNPVLTQQEALFAMPNVATSQLQRFHTFKNAMNIMDKKQEVGEESGNRKKPS